MHRVVALVVACVVLVGMSWAAPPEAAVQGLYRGTAWDAPGSQKIEARLVACGRGTYKIFLRELRVEKGWMAKGELDGKAEDAAVCFSGKVGGVDWTLTWADGKVRGTCGSKGTVELARVTERPPTLGLKPPAGAIVLLDGKNFEELTRPRLRSGEEQPWKPVEGGGIVVPKGGMNSKRQFAGSFTLHVEFRLPLMPEARDQGRSNSGVYLPNGDEIQVLDSFGMTSYKGGGCGGVYAYKDPDAFDRFSLASLPPLEWQTFDIAYRVQKKDGKPAGRPRVTVHHNGIKIHDNFEVQREARRGGFHFQDHGNPVEYRNIWVLAPEDR